MFRAVVWEPFSGNMFKLTMMIPHFLEKRKSVDLALIMQQMRPELVSTIQPTPALRGQGS